MSQVWSRACAHLVGRPIRGGAGGTDEVISDILTPTHIRSRISGNCPAFINVSFSDLSDIDLEEMVEMYRLSKQS